MSSNNSKCIGFPIFCWPLPVWVGYNGSLNEPPIKSVAWRPRGRPEQMVPGLEHDVSVDGSQVFEEFVCRAPGDDGVAPGGHGQPRGNMACEGQQIECHQAGGEGFLTVPEIVFEIVSVGPSSLTVS